MVPAVADVPWLANVNLIRFGAFAAIFLAMAAAEALAPRRQRTDDRRARWWTNLGMSALDAVAVRVVFPLVPVGVGVLAQEQGWGLFQIWDLPLWAAALLGAVALDFAIYLQHVMFHAVPALWRLHMVHHTDLDLDASSGLRFHPLEIIFSLAYKMLVVLALGVPAIGVLLFEIALNATSIFNHANLRLPGPVDRVLRWLVVTPDMHRVHHSTWARETNTNFGFNLPWWDRILGTYRAQPRGGHRGMELGLKGYRDGSQLRLGRALALPFRERGRGYAIAERGSEEPEGPES